LSGPTGDVERGLSLYAVRCSGCHGARGAGDGEAAAWLSPRPANLAGHTYAPRRLADALWHGAIGTSMPAWRDYSPSDLAALAAAVARFSQPDALAATNAERIGHGRDVYAANCAQCHGETGDGLGSAAAAQRVAPTDFRGQRANRALTLEAIRRGVEGTSMGAWADRLGTQDIEAVADYVQSLFQADASTAPAPAAERTP
jgi:mono/diheme cytochrome c family protein